MKDNYESLYLKNQLCFPIYLCSKEIIRRYDKVLKNMNLTYTQYVVMMYFWEKGSTNVKELSKTIMIDSSTLTPLLKKLEKKGYISRKKSLIDERNLLLELTPVGENLKNEALKIPKEMGNCINISLEEKEYLYHILYRIICSMEKEN